MRRLSLLAALVVLLTLSLTMQSVQARHQGQLPFGALQATEAPTMAATATSGQGKILYKETFDTNTVDWETDEMNTVQNGQGRAISIIKDGVYHIEWVPPQAQTNWIIAPGFNDRSLAPVFKGSYDVEIQIVKLAPQSGLFMIGLVFNEQDKYNGWNAFSINQDSQWFVTSTRTLNSSQGTILASGTLDPLIDFTKGTHTLAVHVDNDIFTLRVDNQVIDRTVTDDTFTEGSVGMILGGDPVTVDFDNLIVHAVNK